MEDSIREIVQVINKLLARFRKYLWKILMWFLYAFFILKYYIKLLNK